MRFKTTFTVYVDIPPEDVPLDDDYPDFIDGYVAEKAWDILTKELDFECEYTEEIPCAKAH